MKKELYFEGSCINSISEFHSEFSKLMDFPSYYGNTLDDLWDFMMGQVDDEIKIFINDFEHLKKIFGPQQVALCEIFERLHDQNSKIEIVLS